MSEGIEFPLPRNRLGKLRLSEKDGRAVLPVTKTLSVGGQERPARFAFKVDVTERVEWNVCYWPIADMSALHVSALRGRADMAFCSAYVG